MVYTTSVAQQLEGTSLDSGVPFGDSTRSATEIAFVLLLF